MKREAIIKSLLDQDLYKFSMCQCVFHQFAKQRPWVRIKFKCRNANNLAKYVDEINEQLDYLCTLRFTKDELNYLRTRVHWLSHDFIDFLEMLQLKREYIKCWVDANNELQIVAEGPWIQVIWFEIFVLSIVQEVWTYNEYYDIDFTYGRKALQEKIDLANNYGNKLRFNFADFGSRRRFSFDWHREVITELSKLHRTVFTGTSNVLFAKEFNLAPIGTMAHEYLQAGQALGPRIVNSQKFMLETWVQEYRGDLGIALTDVVGFDAFLRDFDKYFAKLYDGCRHDSGDPFQWCERLIAHYQSFGIDPMTKTAVFSDGLTFPLAFEIAERFRGRIKTSFGIGTNLTNDVGVTPLQVVMKMVECNGSPVAKISDSSGKGMCEDAEYLAYVKKVFNIKE